MMDGTFVKALAEQVAQPHSSAVNGKDVLLIPQGWRELTPEKPPSPSPIELVTLTGLREYIAAHVDALPAEKLMLHVCDHVSVKLIGALDGEEAQFRRSIYATALSQPALFPFGSYANAETFMVGLQTGFVQTAARDELVRLVASIRESDVRETVDDGVAQEVKTARGVALTERTRVPNPVTLQPYRTFREVFQPESGFVLRMQTGDGARPGCALFECDGGAWKLEAIANVATWLRANTEGIAIVA